MKSQLKCPSHERHLVTICDNIGNEGFQRNQTSDHIFLLQTIVEKVVKKNRKKLFCVFVDLKKRTIP